MVTTKEQQLTAARPESGASVAKGESVKATLKSSRE